MKKLLFTIVLVFNMILISAQTALIQPDGYVDVNSGELNNPANIIVVEDGVVYKNEQNQK